MGSRPAAAGSPDHLAQGRDAADAALRLATRHHLDWHELDALHASGAVTLPMELASDKATKQGPP
jgi:hypothetical protein